MSRRVAPSADLEGATAKVLEPPGALSPSTSREGGRFSANSPRSVLSRPKKSGVLCTNPAITSRPRRGVEPGQRFFGMERRVMVEALRVGLAEGAGLRAQRLAAALHDLADAEQRHHVVVGSALAAEGGGQTAAGRQQRALEGGEVVLRVRPGQAVGDVRVGAPEHVGHAPAVAQDAHVVPPGRRHQARGVEPLRPEGVDGGAGQEEQQRAGGATERSAHGPKSNGRSGTASCRGCARSAPSPGPDAGPRRGAAR